MADVPLFEPVKYTVRDIANKMAILDREVKYLVNKAKIWRPKPKEEPAKNKTSEDNPEEPTVEVPENSETPESPVSEDEDSAKIKEAEETIVEVEKDAEVENSDDNDLPDVTEETLNLPEPDAVEIDEKTEKEETHEEL